MNKKIIGLPKDLNLEPIEEVRKTYKIYFTPYSHNIFNFIDQNEVENLEDYCQD